MFCCSCSAAGLSRKHSRSDGLVVCPLHDAMRRKSILLWTWAFKLVCQVFLVFFFFYVIIFAAFPLFRNRNEEWKLKTHYGLQISPAFSRLGSLLVLRNLFPFRRLHSWYPHFSRAPVCLSIRLFYLSYFKTVTMLWQYNIRQIVCEKLKLLLLWSYCHLQKPTARTNQSREAGLSAVSRARLLGCTMESDVFC